MEGWVAGTLSYDTVDFGLLRHTIDGGQTWQSVGPDGSLGGSYDAIDFAGSQGWIVGDDGLVLRSSDGGATWVEHRYSPAANLLSVQLAGPDTAYIGGEGGLVLRWDASSSPCMVTPTAQPRTSATPQPSGTVSMAVRSCVDDAHERQEDGVTNYTNSSVLVGRSVSGAATSTYNGGLLFRSVQLPRYTRIASARLKLYSKGIGSTPVTVRISAERRDIGRDFSPANPRLGLRPRTTASVSWTLTGPDTGWVDSPDLAPIIQELVSRGDWLPGNELALLLDTPTGATDSASFGAYDGGVGLTAQLEISYYKAGSETPTSTPTPTATVTVSPTDTTTPTPTATWTSSVTPTLAGASGSKAYLPLIVR
jgi:hypothetical protein